MTNGLYDEIDMRDARRVGFWTGALSGAGGTFILCILVGLYLT